jgi:hypothetical protein
MMPRTDDTLMIEPPPARRIDGMTALIPRNEPV